MSAASDEKISRRALLTGAIAATAATFLPTIVRAEREYANVGFLGGSDIIDINNANARAYLKLRGFYPGLAGLIVSNGPYKSVDDLYNLPGLTAQMKGTLDGAKDKLIALEPTPEYEIDKINNGLYR